MGRGFPRPIVGFPRKEMPKQHKLSMMCVQ
jgi:hypothetical protein